MNVDDYGQFVEYYRSWRLGTMSDEYVLRWRRKIESHRPRFTLADLKQAVEDVAAVRPRILVAEDNPTNQIVLKGLLTACGADATVVENGLKAIEAWAAQTFDLILLDLHTPAATVAAHAPFQVAVDGPDVDPHSRRKALYDRSQARTVGLSGSQEAEGHLIRPGDAPPTGDRPSGALPCPARRSLG